MRRGAMTRFAAAVVAVGVMGAVVVAVLFVTNGSRGFSECSGVAGTGWVVPILAGLVIGAILWLLSAQAPKYDDGRAIAASAECPECGSSVRTSWRLCPECGVRLED